MQEVILNQEQLEKLCREWQGILGLSEWDVVVSIEREVKMTCRHSQGCHNTIVAIKKSFIQIIDPVDYPLLDVGSRWPQDMEQDLVHELVHLTMVTWNREVKNDLEDVVFEQTVEQLAKTFVKLKRKED